MTKTYTLSPLNHNGSLPADFYDKLNPNQREVVAFNEGPLLVIAGAGSGKTNTLVHRVARLVDEGVAPEQILLLTFTRKASEEMLSRAAGILDDRCRKVSGGTFHSFANIILRQYAKEIGFEDGFTILDRSDAEDICASIRKKMGLSDSEKRFPKKSTVASIIGKAVNTGRPVESIMAAEFPHYEHFSAEMQQIYDQYRTNKRVLNVMDYDDLLVYFVQLLNDHPDIAEHLSQRYQYIMVDEYQDTNPLQAQIILNLCKTHQNVMVVGDDAQSIYSFRGADIKNIMSLPNQLNNTKIIKLEQNYRSTQPILDISNKVIEEARDRYAKELFSDKASDKKPIFIETSSENEQSRFICQRILELREEGIPLEEIAVLFRSSAHANDLEVQLKSCDIPYAKFGGFKFIETAHVKDIVAYMKIILNPMDAISWQRILQLFDGLGAKGAEKIVKAVREFLKQRNPLNPLPDLRPWKNKSYALDLELLMKYVFTIQNKTPGVVLEKVLEAYEPYMKTKFDDYPKRQADLESLKPICARYDNLEDFLTEMSLEPPEASQVGADARPQDDEKLTISTIHSAKGLEWNTVFIISLVDGYFPSFRSLTDADQLEEERRLLYVAMTRAKENLYLLKPHLEMTAQQHYQFQGFQFSQKTRFIDDPEFDDYWEHMALKEENLPGAAYGHSQRSAPTWRPGQQQTSTTPSKQFNLTVESHEDPDEDDAPVGGIAGLTGRRFGGGFSGQKARRGSGSRSGGNKRYRL